MKIIKILVSASSVTFIVAIVFAFTPLKKYPPNLFQLHVEDQTCVQAQAVSYNTGIQVLPDVGYSGFYTTSYCNTAPIVGYLPTFQ